MPRGHSRSVTPNRGRKRPTAERADSDISEVAPPGDNLAQVSEGPSVEAQESAPDQSNTNKVHKDPEPVTNIVPAAPQVSAIREPLAPMFSEQTMWFTTFKSSRALLSSHARTFLDSAAFTIGIQLILENTPKSEAVGAVCVVFSVLDLFLRYKGNFGSYELGVTTQQPIASPR